TFEQYKIRLVRDGVRNVALVS
ncbi:unnamed protein product, partial [Rotaria sp. Silwood2]